MNRKDYLCTELGKALASRGLPRNPAQVVGRMFCLIYVAPLTDEDNDKRFDKYYSTKGFDEYMEQSLSNEEGEENEEVNPEEFLLFEEAVYGTITGIIFDGVDQSCLLQINPIISDRGTVTWINLNEIGPRYGGDQMPRIYPDIDGEGPRGNGFPCSLTLL